MGLDLIFMGIINWLTDDIQSLTKIRKQVKDAVSADLERIEEFNPFPKTGKTITEYLLKRFVAPASTKPLGHDREFGGLVKHTMKVVYNALHFAGRQKTKPEIFNQIVLLGLAHDLGKLFAYKINGKILYWHWRKITRDIASVESVADVSLGVERRAMSRHGQLSLYILREIVDENVAIAECGGEEGWMNVLWGIANFHTSYQKHTGDMVLSNVAMGDRAASDYSHQHNIKEKLGEFLQAIKNALERGYLAVNNPAGKYNIGERQKNTLTLFLTHPVINKANDILREAGAPGHNIDSLLYMFQKENYQLEEKQVMTERGKKKVVTVKITNFFVN